MAVNVEFFLKDKYQQYQLNSIIKTEVKKFVIKGTNADIKERFKNID